MTVAACSAATAACVAPKPATASTTPAAALTNAIEAHFTLVQVGDAPTGTALSATDLIGLREGAVPWAFADAGGSPIQAPTLMLVHMRRMPDGRWLRSAPEGTRLYSIAADGTLSMDQQTDARDGATSLYDPPLRLSPAQLAAGEEIASDTTVSVMRGVARDRDDARARRTTRITGRDRIRTPLGECDATRVETSESLKAPFASMRRDATLWILPGEGPVAIRVDERVLVMGVVPRDRHELLVRLPAVQTPSGSAPSKEQAR